MAERLQFIQLRDKTTQVRTFTLEVYMPVAVDQESFNFNSGAMVRCLTPRSLVHAQLQIHAMGDHNHVTCRIRAMKMMHELSDECLLTDMDEGGQDPFYQMCIHLDIQLIDHMSGAELIVTNILFEQFEHFHRTQRLHELTEHILDHLNVPASIRDSIAQSQLVLRPAPIITIKQKSLN